MKASSLRDVAIEQLRALLDEEAAHWEAELHWDFASVHVAVAGGVERGTLNGRVLGDEVRPVAYSYYLGDVGRTIVGSIFASRSHRGKGLEIGRAHV